MLFKGKQFSILKTKFWDLHQDWETPIPGFFILAIRRKGIKSIADFTDQELEEFGKILRILIKGMHQTLKIKEVYLFQNEDSKHDFHLWIFPRHLWMDKFGRKIESVRPIINWAKRNLNTPKVHQEILDYVRKIKEWMENSINFLQ